jgi:hypothetical protein
MAKHPPTLRYAPYRTPACAVGDRLVCRFAGEQVVAGITSAPIPWPFFWGPQFRRTLFVFGDLERALKYETTSAIVQEFEAQRWSVIRWRRVLAIKAFMGPFPSKLSEDQGEQVRARAAAGERTRSLACEYGISVAYVSSLVRKPFRRRRRPASPAQATALPGASSGTPW